MYKVFIDSHVILDLLAKRVPHYFYSAMLFSLIDKGKIRAFSSSLIFSNLFYILRKLENREKAISSLKKLSLLVDILSVDSKIIDLALTSDFKDFEDAIQYYTALENYMEFIITRNKEDYKKSIIKVCSAEEFLNLYKP